MGHITFSLAIPARYVPSVVDNYVAETKKQNALLSLLSPNYATNMKIYAKCILNENILDISYEHIGDPGRKRG